LDLTTIIADADLRVPNSFTSAQKVDWLNEINQEFFDIVKIPKTATFTTTDGTANYTLDTGIRAKNIDKVHVGKQLFLSFLYDDVPPGHNFYTFDDDTSKITLNPTPTVLGLSGIVKYFKIATTSFSSNALSASPDAPSEYHWIYVLGLCERMAKAMDDVVKGNNYGNDYRGNLLIAQQNYQKGA
jgi:hypothetical protein